ncbi:hypothetical protein PIN31115_01280 [Pandoraea iniqua]|uniref:Uncharacterized protein n=2 Tax=Pandoraea iniqua TaxID=2508288 RepID=A0A5E4T8L1_9BURK|nr:hypothetical protein PIN31115_01280 [Pandoraea iniqua]
MAGVVGGVDALAPSMRFNRILIATTTQPLPNHYATQRNHKDFTMSTIRRNGMSAEAFASLGAGSLVSHRTASKGSATRRQMDDDDEREFTLNAEPTPRVTGPADVLRWLRVWHARQEQAWDGGSALRICVHGGVLDEMVVEARRGLHGITLSLLSPRLTLYRRLLTQRGRLARTMTWRLGLPVTVEVEARYAP